MPSGPDLLSFTDEDEADLRRLTQKAIEIGRTGAKIHEAASKGHVESDRYDFKMDANEQHRIREYAYRVIAAIWNAYRRDATLREVYEGVYEPGAHKKEPLVKGVRQKIVEAIEAGEWPKVWMIPDKRTVDRRVNELAEMHSEHWVFDFVVPPCICLKAGHYRPNPMLYPEEVRSEILGVLK